ncbi:MAG: tetratricopeptide repeat protein [Elainellaceae cyanobacterium]
MPVILTIVGIMNFKAVQWLKTRVAAPFSLYTVTVRVIHKALGNLVLGLVIWMVAIAGLPCFQALAESSPAFAADNIQAFESLKADAIRATQSGDFATAEMYWSQLIDAFPDNAALLSNRGNVRASQNKLDEALADYNQAVDLAPLEADPYLNRGATLEALGRWDEAIADYNQVLKIDPDDVAAFNNRGNAEAGKGNWDEAIADYMRAMEIDSGFLLAQINYDLALYETGETGKAIQNLKGLARKYPRFADARAALTAALWDQGLQGEAESNWVAAYGLDRRYRDTDWLLHIRRWPPSLVRALDRFLKIEAMIPDGIGMG